jgi:hypothetical protein
MSVSTPASFSNLQGNTMKPLLIEDDDPAEFLGIPASESFASTTTQYHSALNSPIPCETSELSTELPVGDLISFSSGLWCPRGFSFQNSFSLDFQGIWICPELSLLPNLSLRRLPRYLLLRPNRQTAPSFRPIAMGFSLSASLSWYQTRKNREKRQTCTSTDCPQVSATISSMP